MDFRTGFGYDVHAFEFGRKLILGGIEVPFEKGLAGHSDADVLLHAVCDALLGAAAIGDIGKHFPDTDEKYKDADSKILLRDVDLLLKNRDFEISNIDSTIVAQRPKLAGYIDPMRETIAEILNIELASVSVKATTSEMLGFTGREEGIAAFATVLISKNK